MEQDVATLVSDIAEHCVGDSKPPVDAQFAIAAQMLKARVAARKAADAAMEALLAEEEQGKAAAAAKPRKGKGKGKGRKK